MVTVLLGLRACTWKVAGTFLICSAMNAGSKRTRFSSMLKPARRKRSMARGCKKSTPISCRICMAWSWICRTCSSERMSVGFSVLVHMSGPRVCQLSRDLTVPPRLEGAGVDLFVIAGIDVARIADGLRVFLRFLGEHRDLILGKAELVERWDVEILGQLVDILDRDFGRLPDGLVGRVQGERLRDSGEALGFAGVVVFHDGRQQAAGERTVRCVVHAARALAHGVRRARRVGAIRKAGQ